MKISGGVSLIFVHHHFPYSSIVCNAPDTSSLERNHYGYSLIEVRNDSVQHVMENQVFFKEESVL